MARPLQIERIGGWSHFTGGNKNKPLAGRLVPRPTWGQIVQAVEEDRQQSWPHFCERHADKGRDLALYLGRKEGRLTLNALARHAGMRSEAAVNPAIKRYHRQLNRGTAKAKSVQACRHRLTQEK